MSLSLLPKLLFPGEICLRPGSLARLKYLTGKRIAVICGQHLLKNEDNFEKIRLYLDETKAKVSFFSCGGGEPESMLVKKLVGDLTRYRPDVLVAYGGGSVIDLVKLARASLAGGEIFLVAIPTTAGSGAEASRSAVILDKEIHRKIPLVSDAHLPDLVILDAGLLLTLPKKVLLFSALDAFIHDVESFCSLRANFLTKELAVTSARLVKDWLPSVFDRAPKIDTLEKLQYAAFLAGIVQDATSVGACHALAHSLGGYGVTHGLACGIVFSGILNFNARHSQLPGEFARRIGFNNVLEMTDFCSDALKTVMVTSRWGGLISDKVDVKILAVAASLDICLRTNPVKTDISDLENILRETR